MNNKIRKAAVLVLLMGWMVEMALNGMMYIPSFMTTSSSVQVILNSFFLHWRYRPHLGLGLPPWNSQFHFGFLLDLRHSVGLLGRVRPLPVHKHRKTQTKHPCPEGDSNPRSRVETILRFHLSNLRECNVGITGGRDLRITPLRWAQVPWYT
jgi:hypothetical protein